MIVQLIRSLLPGIAELDQKIEEVAAEHPDFFIFDSMPGAGAVMASRLLAAFGSRRVVSAAPTNCRPNKSTAIWGLVLTVVVFLVQRLRNRVSM